MIDDTKDNKEEEVETEETGSVEPDFAASAVVSPAFEEEDDIEGDPHSSFDPVTPTEEDPHLDVYGFGVPHGFNGDEEEVEELSEEGVGFDAF